MAGQIEHDGVIDAIGNGTVQVRIVSESACSACHAKGACSAADMQDKIVDVRVDGTTPYRVGQVVTVTAEQSKGLLAVLLAYVVPSVLVIASLLLVFKLWGNDILAGGVALGTAAFYFVVVYLFRERLSQSFSFHIKQS